MLATAPLPPSPAWRVGVFYALLFLVSGASLPYLPVWLRAQGLSGAEIGVVLSLPLLARLVTGPAVAIWADSFRERRTPLIILAGVAAGAYGALSLAERFEAIALCWFLGATAAAGILPLTDVIGLKIAQRYGTSFGRPRSAGSAAFVAANLGLGTALTVGPPWWVLAWMIAAAALTAVAAASILPREPVRSDGGLEAGMGRLRGLGDLLRRPRFLLVIVSAGLIQAAHGFYYGFSTLVWREQGLSEAATGLLWAAGVAAEIVFLWTSEWWRGRLGAERLLLLSGAAAVLRWAVAALGPPLPVLAPLQLLHALTFAGAYVAATRLVDAATPPESASAAHTLSASLQSGLFIGLATLASGALYDLTGAGGYLAMAAVAAAGTGGALLIVRGAAS